mmetsp:Transcript_3121/g.11259  ORF Transcript_3121/g.11259 Transcript_3121/m.11259 type:complete len:231 (-) Transcript_3121:47-739(-)
MRTGPGWPRAWRPSCSRTTATRAAPARSARRGGGPGADGRRRRRRTTAPRWRRSCWPSTSASSAAPPPTSSTLPPCSRAPATMRLGVDRAAPRGAGSAPASWDGRWQCTRRGGSQPSTATTAPPACRSAPPPPPRVVASRVKQGASRAGRRLEALPTGKSRAASSARRHPLWCRGACDAGAGRSKADSRHERSSGGASTLMQGATCATQDAASSATCGHAITPNDNKPIR